MSKARSRIQMKNDSPGKGHGTPDSQAEESWPVGNQAALQMIQDDAKGPAPSEPSSPGMRFGGLDLQADTGPIGGAGQGDGGKAASDPDGDDAGLHAMAAEGLSGSGGSMPFGQQIQASFGQHDVSGVSVHQDSRAADAAAGMGAKAYASGDDVAMGGPADLHTMAHEAAHTVQQRGGVQLQGGVGKAGDSYERHADAVADKVVAGESAEGLLDQVASPEAGGGGAGVQQVQRSVAGDIKREKLGEKSYTYGISSNPAMAGPTPFHGPSGGVEYFSGNFRTSFKYGVEATGQLSDALISSDPGQDDSGSSTGSDFPGGTRSGHTRDKFVADYPQMAEKKGASWEVGSAGQSAKGEATISELAYELLGAPGSSTAEAYASKDINWSRKSADDPWYSSLNSHNEVTAAGKEYDVSTTHEVRTDGDGGFLAKLANEHFSVPFDQVLLDWSESCDFAEILKKAPVGAMSAFYNWARQGIWSGGAAVDWIRDASNRDHLSFAITNLQRFEHIGTPEANTDLNAFVAGVTSLLNDPDTDEATKQELRSMFQSGLYSDLLKMTAGAFPTMGEDGELKPQDEKDASVELARLAGRAYVERNLLPKLGSTLDPIGFIQNYPMADTVAGRKAQARVPKPATDLANEVAAETSSISKTISEFFNKDLTLGNVTPGTSYGRVPHATSESDDNLALHAIKWGAAESIIGAGQGSGTGIVSKRLGVGMAAMNLHASAPSGGGGTPVTLSAVLNAGAGKLGKLSQADGNTLKSMGEGKIRTNDANSAEWHRGDALRSFGTSLQIFQLSNDVQALRKGLGALQQTVVGQIAKGDILTYLTTQSAIALTNSNMAFQIALTRGREDLYRNVQGLVEQQAGGVKWVTNGMLALNTIKELAGFYAAAAEFAGKTVSGGMKFAGPALAIVSFALDAVIGLHDAWVKDQLSNKRAEVMSEAEATMKKFEGSALSKIRAQAGAEQQRYARGDLRTTSNATGFFAGLQAGTSGVLGNPAGFTLDDLNENQMQELYQGLINCQGVPYNEVYQGALQVVKQKMDTMWAQYSKAIEAVGSTWK